MPFLYVVLLFVMPALYWPPWGGGGDPTFMLPRLLLVMFLSPWTPWANGWWTPLEWCLLWIMAVQLVLHPDGATGFATLVLLGGLAIVRAGRGLPETWRTWSLRWWPAALVFPLLLWWIQVFLPTFDLFPHSPWHARPSTYGNPIFVAEAMLPLLSLHPLGGAVALVTVASAHARGVFAAGAVALLLHRRWLLAAACVIPLAVMLSVTKPSLQTLEVRTEIWRRVGRLVLAQPLLGVGTGRLTFATQQGGVPHETSGMIRRAHNDYLERAAEWGLIGGALFTVWVAWIAWRDVGLTAIALAALTQFPLGNPASWAMFCFLGGLTTRHRYVEPEPLRRRFLEG